MGIGAARSAPSFLKLRKKSVYLYCKKGKNMKNIYLINIDDVNEHIDNNMDSTIEYAESLTEEQCHEICDKSADKRSGCYTFKEFEAEFNYDIDNIFTSDRYFIRFF